MKNRIRKTLYTTLTTVVMTTIVFFSIITYILLYDHQFDEKEQIIFILSVIGWIELAICIISMKIKTGRWISLYSGTISLAFLFTFGQCLFWAMGVHTKDEIGINPLYTYNPATKDTIIKTQLMTLAGLLVFHFGAFISYRKKNSAGKNINHKGKIRETERNRNILYKTSIIINTITTPIAIFNVARSIIINQTYGYGATFNNAEIISTQNNILILLGTMFIPSIFGLLISSKYNKKMVIYCYLSFVIYTLLGIIAGDRGEWLLPLLLLLWMHHRFYKPIHFKGVALCAIVAVLILAISVGIRNSRRYGVTIEGLAEAVKTEDSPIISAAFEMGNSMGPSLVLTQYGWDKYPYGNTYLQTIIGMVTEKPLSYLIDGYKGIQGWFSEDYLGIKYGAGFSFIAEAFANYGPYYFLIAMLIIGIIFTKLVFRIEEIDYKIEPIITFLGISTANSILLSIRNTIIVAAKYWVYSTLIYLIIYYILKFAKNRQKRDS